MASSSRRCRRTYRDHARRDRFLLGIIFIYVLISRGPSIQDDSTLVLRPGGDLPGDDAR